MTDQTLILLSLASVFTGLLSAILFGFWLKIEKWWQKALVKAPVYGLFLGIGIIGGGNSETGFAFPIPIIPAFLASASSDRFLASIVPFVVWTIIFFFYESIKYRYCLVKSRRLPNSK